jgi:predicted amidophosphoribosyltransferase
MKKCPQCASAHDNNGMYCDACLNALQSTGAEVKLHKEYNWNAVDMRFLAGRM